MQRAEDVIRPSLGNHRVYEAIDAVRSLHKKRADTNCPNCGAPRRGSVCQYCGTHFGRHEGSFTFEYEPHHLSFFDWDGTELRLEIEPNVKLYINDEEVGE